MKRPEIETLAQAEAIGEALHDVLLFTPSWAPRVFSGDPTLTFQTGPAALNNELESMWNNYLSDAEKKAILVKYVEYRLT